MINNIILASKSGVRKEILMKHGISCEVIPSNVDEDQIKESLLKESATPEIISKNLAELKANKVSSKKPNHIVIGADSVIDLNGKEHQLISSVCISKNGSMIWNFTDAAKLTMKKLNLDEIKSYLKKN